MAAVAKEPPYITNLPVFNKKNDKKNESNNIKNKAGKILRNLRV